VAYSDVVSTNKNKTHLGLRLRMTAAAAAATAAVVLRNNNKYVLLSGASPAFEQRQGNRVDSLVGARP